MKRRFFDLMSILVFALLPVEAMLWWRSYMIRDELSFSQKTRLTLASDNGHVQYAWSSCYLGDLTNTGPNVLRAPSIGPATYAPKLELQWEVLQSGRLDQLTRFSPGMDWHTNWTYPTRLDAASITHPLVHDVFAITLPHAVVTPLLAILPSLWVLRYVVRSRRLNRIRRGLCTVCGYDLRASKERCPECGAKTPTSVKAIV